MHPRHQAETRQASVDETWPASPACAPQRLVLTWGAHEVEVSDAHPSLTVGRGDVNDIVIKSDSVSRLHARIEYRNGSFCLIDHSGNGTYVAAAGGGAIRLSRNDRHVLAGAGTISFGVNPDTGRPQLVRYAVGF